jgi:hypothetical protein
MSQGPTNWQAALDTEHVFVMASTERAAYLGDTLRHDAQTEL